MHTNGAHYAMRTSGLIDNRVYECAALIAGGSLQAAAALASGRYRTAVHFDGGRHHAHKSQAAGFCYVNDVVGGCASMSVGGR